MAQIYTK